MMTDDETEAAIKRMTDLTVARKLAWSWRADGTQLVTKGLDGFEVVITVSEHYQLQIFDLRKGLISSVAPTDERDTRIQYGLEGLIYALAKAAENAAGTDESQQFMKALEHLENPEK